MNKNIKNSLGILICLVIIVGLGWFIADTYAKYREQIDGTTNANMARWNIKVNSEEIKNKTTLTSALSAYFPATTYTAAGVIAPGSQGYFDIIIDSSQVDVAFTYTISSAVDSESAISDIRLLGYKVNPSGLDDMTNMQPLANGNVSGNIGVATTNTTVRVFVEWFDGSGETMDNDDDTDTVLNNNVTVIMDVSIGFTQLR
jgi:hypothetical protein